MSVKCKTSGYFVTFRNPCRRQRGEYTSGWVVGICDNSVLGRVLCHPSQWSGPTLRVPESLSNSEFFSNIVIFSLF